jgi:hypothetical protein
MVHKTKNAAREERSREAEKKKAGGSQILSCMQYVQLCTVPGYFMII